MTKSFECAELTHITDECNSLSRFFFSKSYEHLDTIEFVDVTTCSLDAPWAFPPTHHSWISDDIGWVKFGDGLPSFQRSRFGDPS